MQEPIKTAVPTMPALQRRNALCANLCTWAGGVIALLICVYVVAFTSLLAKTDTLRPGLVLNLIPAIFYLWALFAVRRVFLALSQDVRSRYESVADALSRIGWGLMLGAASTAIPILNLFWQPKQGGGNLIAIVAPSLTIFVLGLALTVLAPLLRQAADIETELKEFF